MQIDPAKGYGNLSSASQRVASDNVEHIQKTGAFVDGAAGFMGNGIGVRLNQADTETFRRDVNLGLVEKAGETAAVTHEKARIAKKLAGQQYVRIVKDRLVGPPITFKKNPPLPEEIGDDRSITGKFLDDELGSDTKLRKEVSNVGFLIEAVKEDINLKQNLLGFWSLALPDGSILASNSSSFTVAEMAKKVPAHLRDKVVLLHFFAPSDRHPLVEIMAGPETSLETVLGMKELVTSMGGIPIVFFNDRRGAIANTILVGVLNK